VEQGRVGEPLPVTASEWTAATAQVFAELAKLQLAGIDDLLARSEPVAIWVIVRLALAGGLGLIAVIASVVISITTARSILRQLQRLRDAAQQLAVDRLPRVVDQLRRGDEVDVDVEAPPLSFGTDE